LRRAVIVARDAQGREIGSELLKRCEAEAKKARCEKIWLWTLPNIPAHSFYRKRGYHEEARLKGQFGGKDLCLMSKFL